MKAPSPRLGRCWSIGWKYGLGVCFFCSFSYLACGIDIETQELKVTVEALRKENAKLRQVDAMHQQELATATNRFTKFEFLQKTQGIGLMADDEEVRNASEWRAFLLSALKILYQTDQERQALQKRLQLLLYTTQQAFGSAEKVDPAKRTLLESEVRQSQKALSDTEEGPVPTFVSKPAPTMALSPAKVIGVRLDLGVAALGIGHKQGAKVGMPFLVTRGKTVMAVLTLAEVRENAALALIEQMEPDKPIEEGDVAVLRKTTK